MEILLAVLLGMFIGAMAFKIFLHFAMRRASQDLSNLLAVIEKLQQSMIICRVEEHHGIFYIYNVTDNSFVAQGKDLEEIRQAAERRWKNIDIMVNEGDKEVIDRLKATGTEASA